MGSPMVAAPFTNIFSGVSVISFSFFNGVALCNKTASFDFFVSFSNFTGLGTHYKTFLFTLILNNRANTTRIVQ